jgi:hypothetical protein
VDRIAVAKLTTAGAVDASFGTSGVFTADPGGQGLSLGADLAV